MCIRDRSQATADAQAKHLRELRAEQERGDALSEKLLFTNAENAKLSNDLKKRVDVYKRQRVSLG